MIIRKNTPYSLWASRRGIGHIAQGNALGTNGKSNFRLERAKAFNNNAFALSGREMMHSRDTQGDTLGYALLAFQAVRGIFADNQIL
ncbi:MAG: hypothetical protein K6B45_06535 [Bacteroidaceae bacterium]|nr:hypothetical protein [Bacteroidaceae bacterium]